MYNYLYKGQDRDITGIDTDQMNNFIDLWDEIIMELNHKVEKLFTDVNIKTMSE